MPKQKKEFRLTDKDYAVYRLLESNPEKWWTKGEIVDELPEYFNESDSTSHDFCASLNNVRIRLNRVAGIDGKITHYTILKNNAFKLANKEELKAERERMKSNLWRDYIRYLRANEVIQLDGQGKLFDCNGNPIDEDSLAKKFFEPFAF